MNEREKINYTCRLSRKMLKELEQKAKKNKTKKSKIIRASIQNYLKANFIDGLNTYEELLKTFHKNSNHLGGMGNNINQIAKYVNSGGVLSLTDLDETLKKINKTLLTLSKDTRQVRLMLNNIKPLILI